MKRTLAMLLTLALSLPLAGAVAVAADGETGTPKADHEKLVTHWDFEGEGEEIWSDKAQGGKSSDTLEAHGSIVTSGGIAYIPADKNTYLSAPGGEDTDLSSFSRATVLMRVRLENEGNRGGVAAFVSKQSAFEWTLDINDLSNLRARVNNAKTNAGGTVKAGMKEFRYYAMVYDYNAETGKFTATAYQSNTPTPAGAADFSVVSQSVVDAVNAEQPIVTSTHDLIFGRRYDHLAKNRALLCWFKDIKVYSDVLSPGDLAAECDGSEIDFSYFEDYDKMNTGSYFDELKGIGIMAIGDSYLDGSGLHYSWIDLLSKKYRMPYADYAVGGTTVAKIENYTEDRVPMVLRYEEMLGRETAPQIIFIEGGRNDRQNKVPLGEIDSTDPATYLGALNVLIDRLHQGYPDALIVCLTPWGYLDKNGAEDGFHGTTADYAAKMVALCAARGVACMNCADKNISGVDMNDADFFSKYSLNNSVSHLNEEGMTYVLPFFEKWIAGAYRRFLSDGQNILAVTDLKKDTETDSQPNTDTDTEPTPTGSAETPTGSTTATEPAEEPKAGGCASSVGFLAPVLTAAGAVCILRKKKKED